MKKMSKNMVLTIIVFAIISVGFLNINYPYWLLNSAVNFGTNVKNEGVFEAISIFTDEVENISTEQLAYHDLCVNLNSAFMRFTNKRVVEKDDVTVVKMDNGMLAGEVSKIPEEDIILFADSVKKLQDDTGIPVTYVMAPEKGYDGGFPSNADNYIAENCNLFLKELENRGINYLDLCASMIDDKMTVEESFYATDHHWKPEVGLWAANEICEKMESDYDFQYDKTLLEIDNYNIDTYENTFLGSEGRKTGIYYTKYGLEDFDVLYPKFSTDLTVTNKIENTEVSGAFKDTVLNLKHLSYDTPYQSWLYSTYSDGDNAVQVIENKLNQEGKTVLVVRDSFAGVVTPFIALECKSLHVLDLRTDVIGTNRVESVSEYAKEIQPDYIIILYKTVKTPECYEFR